MERKNTHIPYAIITAIVMIIANLSLYMADLSFEPWAKWIGYGIFLIGILLNAIAFSKANDGFVTFGNVFSSGFKASAVITLITLVWSLISLWIFPEMVEKGLEIAREQMTARGMSDEQMDQAIEMTRNNFKLFMVMSVVFGTMFFGAIFSLIGAAIAKKKGHNPVHQA